MYSIVCTNPNTNKEVATYRMEVNTILINNDQKFNCHVYVGNIPCRSIHDNITEICSHYCEEFDCTIQEIEYDTGTLTPIALINAIAHYIDLNLNAYSTL